MSFSDVLARGINMELNTQQEKLCETTQWDFSNFNVISVDYTLKRSPIETRHP